MNDDYLKNMDELETEFIEEVRGFGSLAVVLADGADGVKGSGFIGFDVRPEDIEALYFEGIGTLRWDNIEAESVSEQMDIYNDSMKKKMADYPLIARVSDTDVKVNYTPEEVLQLRAECEKVFDNTSAPKAVRAVQKFLIACHKADESRMSLELLPN